MARVTVEDCVEKVPNRFNLVLLAAHRARAISAGAPLLIDRDNDKNPVVSLREIADDVLDAEGLREALIASLQRVDERSDAEEAAEHPGPAGRSAAPAHERAPARGTGSRSAERPATAAQEERYWSPRAPERYPSRRRPDPAPPSFRSRQRSLKKLWTRAPISRAPSCCASSAN